MLKTALFDCAINEKCCSVDGGRGICPLFSSPPRGIWQLKSPHPREFAIQGQKNDNARGSARGVAGRRWNWLIHNILFPPLSRDGEKVPPDRRLNLPCLEGQTKLFFLSECNRDLQTCGLSKFRKGITDGVDFLPSAVQVSSFHFLHSSVKF